MILYERRQKHLPHTHTLCTTQFFISFHCWGDLLPSPSSPCMSYDGCTLQHARFSKLVFLWLSQRVNKSLLLLAWACSSASKAHFMNVLTIPFVPTNPCYISLLLDDMFSGLEIWFLDTPKNGLLVKWTTRLLHSLASLTNNPEYIVVPLSFWQ